MEALSHESASSNASLGHINDQNNNHYTNKLLEKCSSCGTEQATVVCSACSSHATTNANNLDCLPALKASPDLHLNEYYNSASATGHMVYCADCFRITHANLDTSKHVALHIAAQQPEDIKLIVEDKMDDLLDQIELSSHGHSSALQLERLRRRIGQLNDVKQSIREMNEMIRDDLYVDFGALADLMQKKLNEISDRIKEKLKDAYSVVRDLHGRLNERMEDVEQTMGRLEEARSQAVPDAHKIKLLETHVLSQIDQVNEQLRWMSESNGHSCTALSCSLFVDNNLYPQFSYSVDLSKLIEAVNRLDVKISGEASEPSANLDQLCARNGFEFDALVHTGIHSDGSFWVEFVGASQHTGTAIDSFRKNRIKSERLLEQMSRCVRSASIGDPHWLTYDQLDGQSPTPGQLCFCLDEKTRKWRRARVLSVCASTNKCHVIYVDTGVSHENNLHPFENVLPWRHFQLTELAHRAIKCVLHNARSPLNYERDIHQQAKFEFKDMTANKAMRCALVELNQDQAWICQLYQINEESSKREQFVSVNKKIIELNRKAGDHDPAVKFASRDIRLLLNPSSSCSSSSSSFTPKVNAHVTHNDECSLTTSDEPFDTNLELSSVLNAHDGHEENADVEDQVAERRFYKNSSGMCHVTTSVSNEGIFWIKPTLRHNLHDEFEKMSALIDDFIRRTNYRSYAELKIEPDKHKKCFVRASLRKSAQFYRGFIEKVWPSREVCRVRLMDCGQAREAAYADIYPHRRLDFNSLATCKGRDTDGFNDTDNHGLKLNYLAIRCSLFQTNFNNVAAKRSYFNSLVANKRVRFNLVEQVTINQLKCWYTEIYAHNGQLINMSVFNALANHAIKGCVSSGASTATSNTNRDWQPIETRPVMSMYDLKETSLDTLDESASIKVKSDAQAEQFRVKTKYVSCPLFADEPEWLVNTDQIVNQPSFVTDSHLLLDLDPNDIDLDLDRNDLDTKKQQRQQTNKKRRRQCRPFGSDNHSNWRNGRGGDGSGGGGGGGGTGSGTGGGTGNNSKSKSSNTNNKSRWRRSHASREHKNGGHVTHESDNSSSALNDVFLNNNENSSLDQEELEAAQQPFDEPMNSSPNSAYHKLFKLNGNVNSYEQVLSCISENERVDEEAEKVRSLHLTQKGQFVSSKIEANDTSLDSMPRLIIDQTDDDEAFNEPVHPTLDQTHQIPNRHIINDTETNRSIKSERPCHQSSAKNRSYSAADVALVERHRLNLRPVLSSSSSSSSSSDTSSLLSDLKKIKKTSDLDSDESFESCDEEVKNHCNELRGATLNKNKCHEAKLERMKKFTVSIFVDDFEADSSKTSNESSTSLSTNNEIEQSRLNPNFFAVKSTECRTDHAKSLDEFENNEAVHSHKRLSALDQHVFMFTANPVHIAEKQCCSLASRPPAPQPLSQPLSQPLPQAPITGLLSTIVELSNECSNNTDTSRHWLSDIEHNSSEFQKKVDFFNKNADGQQQDSDWYRNVTVRRTRRNSRDYDTLLNESRRTKSASSLSDNGHVANSVSNNCLISESFYLSGARLNVTLDASFSSRLRHNSTANSVLVTDQLFERFCLLENDRIMNESSTTVGSSSNCARFRIQSQLLSELLDEPVSMPRRSFSSPDISSYNSDSLFNSHMIITPICSELVSPNQPGSIVSRSISNQQSTPHNKHVNSFKSPTNSSQSSLPPTPPQNLNQPRDEDNNVTFSPIQKVKDDVCNYLKNFPAQNFVKDNDDGGDRCNFSKNTLSRDPNSELQSLEVKDNGCNYSNSYSRDPNSELQVSEVKDNGCNYSNSYSRDLNSILQSSEVKVTERNFSKNFMLHDSNSASQSLKVKDDDDCNFSYKALSRDPNLTLQSSQVKDERLNCSIAAISRDVGIEDKVNESEFLKDPVSDDANALLQTSQQVKDAESNFSNNFISRDPDTKLKDSAFKVDLTNAAALPPAPHYLLLKPSRNGSTTTTTTTRLDKPADPITMSNSCPNLNEPNKHIANYLNTIRKSTGVELEPVVVKRRSNSATRLNNFKSANLSLYGLDNEDEQEAKRKSLSECDSMDAKSSSSSSAQKILSLDVSSEQQADSFKFPPPPEQFMNSSNDTLPPPPDQNELDALINNNNAHPTSSSSQTTVVAVQTESPRLKTFMNSLKNLQSTKDANGANDDAESTKSDHSFKIDHLLDINPKRLYKNSKFKCRINDVIDESGRFWLEVIYGEDDERKFHQMFKYFNLHVRLAEAPECVRPNDHVAALYKNSWHRARVLHTCAPHSSKVKVRFLDLGLDKILDKHTDLRHSDQKFFNFPVKGLLCSLYIDEHVHQLLIEPQSHPTVNKRLRLCREARKHFVKMVYKKILFVKVIELGQEYEAECDAHTSICKIKLGCQARHGIIDVYMYLLSKYDREKYQFLKTLKKYIQSRPPLMSLQQQSLVQTTTITTTTQTNTVSTCTTSSAMASPPDSLNATLKKMQEVECEEEGEAGEEDQPDMDHDDMLDQEEDYYESDEDDVLFTDTVNYYYSKNTNKDASLDLTPVKEHHSRYTQLNISPVDLSSLDTPGHDHAPRPPLDQSTTKVANKLRATAAHHSHAATPIALPPATSLSHKYVKMVRSEQHSLDADTSLTARCCNLAGLKKWAKSSGKSGANLPKTFKLYAQEGLRDNAFDSTLNKSLNAKKVKFQVK